MIDEGFLEEKHDMAPPCLHTDMRSFCRALLVESGPVFGIFFQKPAIFNDFVGNFGRMEYR